MKRIFFALICTLTLVSAFAQGQKPQTAQPVPNAYRMEEGFVDAHGVLIYYKIIGRGAPLMIVHGGPGASHDYLLPHLVPLARTNQLVFIDGSGPGRSPAH